MPLVITQTGHGRLGRIEDNRMGPGGESTPSLSVVHIIDDDESLRAALCSLFKSVGLTAIGYPTVQAFLDAPRDDAPGCLVLDVRLPGTSGLDFQEQLAPHGINLPVILMSGHGDVPMTVRGMKAGALDFLPKPFRDQEMLDIVSRALAQDTAHRSSRVERDALMQRYAKLSPREQEVMSHVVAGRLNKQIAGDLNLSEVTIKIHRGSAMRKMCARTLPDLVRMADALKRN